MVVFVLGAITASDCVPTCYLPDVPSFVVNGMLGCDNGCAISLGRRQLPIARTRSSDDVRSSPQSGETVHDESTEDERAEMM